MIPFYDMLSGGIKKNIAQFTRMAESSLDADLRPSGSMPLQFGGTRGTLDGSYPAHP
jgi:hypothetical protein